MEHGGSMCDDMICAPLCFKWLEGMAHFCKWLDFFQMRYPMDLAQWARTALKLDQRANVIDTMGHQAAELLDRFRNLLNPLGLLRLENLLDLLRLLYSLD